MEIYKHIPDFTRRPDWLRDTKLRPGWWYLTVGAGVVVSLWELPPLPLRGDAVVSVQVLSAYHEDGVAQCRCRYIGGPHHKRVGYVAASLIDFRPLFK